MRTKIKHMLSVITLIAIVMSICTGFAKSPGPRPPYNPPVNPPISLKSNIEFSAVGLTQTTIQQGGTASIYGRVKNARSSVKLTVTLKKYYNSYSAYTVATFTDTMSPNSDGNVFLSDSNIFKSQLNLKSRPTGHYVLEITAQEGIRIISVNPPINFYIV